MSAESAWSNATSKWLSAWRQAGAAWSAAAGGGAPGQPAGAAAGFASFAALVEQALRDGGSAELGPRLAALFRDGATHVPGFEAFRDGPLKAFAALGSQAGPGGALLRENLDTALRWADEWLALPVVGPEREWLIAGQNAQRALIAEQRAALRVSALCEDTLAAARERFARFLEDDEGPPVKSLRALYDLWIGHAEDAWSDMLADEAFSAAFAEWVDAGSEARIAVRACFLRLAEPAGLVRREDLEAVLARERSVRAELDALRAELASVREAVAAAQAARANAPAPAAMPVQPGALTKAAPAKRTTGKGAGGEGTAAAKRARKPAAARKAPAKRKRKRKAGRSGAAKVEFDIGEILAGRD